MPGFRCGSRCVALLVGLAIVLVSWILLQRACSRSPTGFPRFTVVEPIERYDPNTRYEIPLPPQWKPTGRTIDDVPVVEPADERTRRKVEQAFGEEEAKEIDFVLVGEIGRVRHGADVYVDRPKMPEVIPTPDNSIEFGDLPRARTEPPPLRFTLVPKPAPWVDLRSVHRVELAYDWTPELGLEKQWRVEYRPWEMWVKGRVFFTVETGVTQRVGETSFHVSAIGGACLGKHC